MFFHHETKTTHTLHPLNNMTYRLVKRKKASQVAVMLATPSHAIESAHTSHTHTKNMFETLEHV